MWLENFRMALASIRSNLMRSFLTMLGIIIGVAAVIAITGVGNGAVNRINENFMSIGATAIQLFTDPDEEEVLITEEDIQALKDIPNLEYVSSVNQIRANMRGQWKDREAIISYGQTDLQYTDMSMKSDLIHGRYFNKQDYDNAANVIVISEDTAQALFGHSNVVGQTIQMEIQGNIDSYLIIGVTAGSFEDFQGFVDPEDMPVRGAIPASKLQEDGLIQDNIQSLSLRTQSIDQIDEVSNQAVRLLEIRHQVVGEDKYTAYNALQGLNMLNEVLGLFINFITAVAGIALFVGGIGIMNIMLVSVTERTREIGIRKALGAKTSSILGQFLLEAVVLSVLGGLLGIILGAGIAFAIGNALGIQADISLTTIAFVLLFTAIIGVLFGVYPARKAARLDPIEALKYE